MIEKPYQKLPKSKMLRSKSQTQKNQRNKTTLRSKKQNSKKPDLQNPQITALSRKQSNEKKIIKSNKWVRTPKKLAKTKHAYASLTPPRSPVNHLHRMTRILGALVIIVNNAKLFRKWCCHNTASSRFLVQLPMDKVGVAPLNVCQNFFIQNPPHMIWFRHFQ